LPKDIIFGSVAIGKSSNKYTELKNTGTADVTISDIQLTNAAGGRAYRLLTKTDFPKTLGPGETYRLLVQYSPKSAGGARGKIEVFNDSDNVNEDGALVVNLRAADVVPDIMVEPNPVDFGVVKPSSPKVKTFTIKNKGAGTLKLFGFSWKSNKENEFKIETPISFPKDLRPGQDLTVQVKYTPKKIIADEILEIRNNTTGKSARFEVRMVGKMAAPNIELDPTRLVFDKVFVGTKGRKTFTIKNTGSLPLEVKELAMDSKSSFDYSLPNPPSLPFTVQPGKEIKIEVEYNSQDLTDDSGRVVIGSNDPDTPKAYVLLEAKGRGCNLQPTPAKVLFPNPGARSLIITNKGNLPCEYKSAAFSPTTSKEFSFSIPPPGPQKILPGKYIQMEIAFKPSDAVDDKGHVIIESDDPDSPQLKVPIESKLASAHACELTVTPSSVAFGFVATGKSRIKQVTLKNTGYDKCIIPQPAISPNPSNVFAVQTRFPAGGLTIGSNQQIKLEVSYTPGSGSTHTGTLILKSNDKKNPTVNVKLVGATGKLCIEGLPDPLDFGSVKVNCSTPKETLEIFNLCTQSVNVTGVKFSATTNKPVTEFFIKSAPNMPVRLNYGQSFKMQLSYVARNLGKDVGALEVANSAAGQSPVVITMTGEGVSTADQKDIFRQQSKPEIDILFVIDDSCSMGNDQSTLASNLNSFISWASKLQVDYHIGVTTTDTRWKGCTRGSPKFVTRSTPSVVPTLQRLVRVGTSGSASEKGLETSYQAFLPNQLNGCNKAFYRKSASLSIVYISDEPDYSRQSVSFYINFLKNLKGVRNPDKLRASAIQSYRLSTSGTCSGQCRYFAVAKALRGVTDTISSANWGRALSQLGSITFGYKTQFFLSRPADPSTIQVKVNGATVPKSSTSGWTYDGASNSVNFSPAAVPKSGALIEVSYKALCLPP
jgi:hypothetical protein